MAQHTKIRKVAILADFFNSLGGVEYYNALLAQSLKERGIEVQIFSGEKPELTYWQNQLRLSGIEIISPDQQHSDKASREIEKTFIHRVAADLAQWQPDVIHAHPAGKMTISLFELSNRPKIPFVATEWTTPSPSTAHWYQPELPEHVNKIDAYISTCASASKGIREYHGYKGNIYPVPHLIAPTPLSAYTIDPNNQAVGCISRLSVEKGLDFLIGAWSKVAENFPNASLHIYGHGPEEQRLKEMTQCLNLGRSINFEGVYQPIHGIDGVARKHSIFVQPSLFESIPTSAIELIGRGKVIVASRVGGLPDLLSDPQCGILVDRADSGKIATQIKRLFSYPDLVTEFSQKARRKFETEYDLDKTVDRIIQVYESIQPSADMR